MPSSLVGAAEAVEGYEHALGKRYKRHGLAVPSRDRAMMLMLKTQSCGA
jgi:hypothetical protein